MDIPGLGGYIEAIACDGLLEQLLLRDELSLEEHEALGLGGLPEREYGYLALAVQERVEASHVVDI